MDVVLPQNGRGFKNFMHTLRTTVLLQPPFRKSWIHHWVMWMYESGGNGTYMHASYYIILDRLDQGQKLLSIS